MISAPAAGFVWKAGGRAKAAGFTGQPWSEAMGPWEDVEATSMSSFIKCSGIIPVLYKRCEDYTK